MPIEHNQFTGPSHTHASCKARVSKLETALADEISRRRRVVSDATHELANALQGISATLATMKISSDEAAQQDYLDRAMRFFDVAETKLASLRHYALRGEASTRIASERFFPADVIGDILLAFEAEAAANQQRLLFHDAGKRIAIDTDRVRYHQIVSNLMLNAIRHSGPGVISVAIRAEAFHDQACLVTVIEDNGHGIAEDDQKRIFEPYYRGSVIAERRHGGTGMGLAIALETARLLGGRIELESQPGLGTTFTVRLPIEPVRA